MKNRTLTIKMGKSQTYNQKTQNTIPIYSEIGQYPINRYSSPIYGYAIIFG